MSADSKKNNASSEASAPQDFFVQMQQFGAQLGAQFSDAMRAGLERFDAASAQWRAVSADLTKRCLDVTDETARLIKSSVTQASKLGEQWQSSSLEATRRGLEFMASRS